MAVEPDMENLLASIRKAIDSDIGNSVPTKSPFKGTMKELRVNYGAETPKASADEILELRNRINRTRNENLNLESQRRFVPAPPITSTSTSFAQQPDYGEAAYEEPAEYQNEATWTDEQSGYLPAVSGAQGYENYLPDPLLSDEAAVTANSAFNQLADTVMARALGERTIEDMTQDLLRGMLKTWLDNNLPSLVERLVREEIERVARRGR